ncbi:MAG TPA: Gfo/Idh/MocA family oxidoreductase [Thermoguttaceae bacterium]|nr:Gfo/Idh/MocA family oxidoreductase [Thermoguttaceae bacterium]
MSHSPRTPRRRFLIRSAGLVAAGLGAPHLLPSGVLAAPGRPGPNDRIGIAFIGTGRRANQILGNLKNLPSLPGEVQLVALSDVWPKKCHEYVKSYEEQVLGPKGGKTGADYAVHQDYRKLLEQNDVDAVIVATVDHWHALPAIHACQAGKDVYGEKPLTLTIAEGRAMVRAVRKHGRVFQTGTQQRSYLRNRQGCELVRNGRLGKIKEVICTNYESSKPCSEYELPTEPVPEGLDWDTWCGQTQPRPFSMHVYLTYNDPGWQRLREYSGGLMTNWGAHGLDMVQWALGADETGPVEITPHGNEFNSQVSFRYAGGVVVKLQTDDRVLGGGHFIGEKGELVMTRGKFNTVPISISQEPLTDSDVRLHQSDNHLQNFIDCIKSREKCVADVEIGHRTATICHLSGIARQLGRPLRWDPEKEIFPGDDEANGYLDRPKRAPYRLPDPV